MFKFPPSANITHYTYYPQMTPNYLTPKLGNKSYKITAHVDWKPGDEGVLMGGGINSGGFALTIEGGRLRYHYNYLQAKAYDLQYDQPLTPGKHDLVFDFVLTGDNRGIGRLLVDGRPGGQVEIASFPLFPMPGTFAVGRYGEAPINTAHKDRGCFKYTGRFTSIELDLERPADDADKMIDLEQALINQ
jgi:arylsulfatase